MGVRTVFLVYGFDCYEFPYDPIKAFASEAEAQALLAEISAYQGMKPEFPGCDAPDEEFDAWKKANDEWSGAHPAGDACLHDGFNFMPLVLMESP